MIEVELSVEQARALIEHLKKDVPVFDTEEEADEYIITHSEEEGKLYAALSILISEYEFQK